MVSILIPVYNFEISSLVDDLSRQGVLSGEPFEIVCYDDGSDILYKEKNRVIAQKEGVIYKELEENVGRARIRNLLAKEARYSFLLFMDCDSMVCSQSYLLNYINDLNSETLLYGGRTYQEHPPEDADLYFHWHYGSQREQQTVTARSKKPYQSFMTNNFLIPKAIFERIGFNESIREYGHEDTLFGLNLKQEGVRIKHIDNPLEHIGLEPVNDFLAKSGKALENLHRLSRSYPLEQEVRSLRFLAKVRKAGLLKFTRFVYSLLKPIIHSNLRSKKVKLKLFDFYKLAFLADLSLKENEKH